MMAKYTWQATSMTGHGTIVERAAAALLEWDGVVTFDVDSCVSHAVTARRWREKHGYVGYGGVVVLFEGIVNSWSIECAGRGRGWPSMKMARRGPHSPAVSRTAR